MKTRVLAVLAGSALLFGTQGALAVNGCPAGSVDLTASPDGTSYSALFSSWVAEAGQTSKCSVAIPIKTDAPSGNIIVYTSDTRGYRFLENGDKIAVKIDKDGTETVFNDTGPADDDYIVTDLVAASGDKVTIKGQVKVTAPPDSGAIGTVDSIDLTELGRITTATDQTAAIINLGSTAGLLTGGLQPIEGDNYVGLIGGFGSYMFGVNARYNLAEGFSVLGGVSLVNQTAGASQTNGVLGSAALRYVEPGFNSFRLMAEGGLVLGGLQTKYPNSAASVATGLATLYGKGGIITDLTPTTQLAAYGTLSETALSSGAFTQNFTGFTVNTPGQTGFFTTAKATVAITTELAPDVDLTAEASAGMVFSHSGITATIPGIGQVSGAQSSGFIDYGLRLGWEPQQTVRLELFAQGSAGAGTGSHNQIGASAKLKF